MKVISRFASNFLSVLGCITTTFYGASAIELSWFDAVSGAFSDPNRWYVPEEGKLNPIVLRNPNPNRRVPAPGDSVSFTRHGVDDILRIGAAYQVMIPSATLSVLDVANNAFVGTLQPLTFNVGTLTVERLSLNGKTVFTGGGVIVGDGQEHVLNDVTVTGGTIMRLNVLKESNGLTIEAGSSMTANRLNNFVIGLKLRGGSSLKADAILVNGGIDLEGSYYPDISGGSALETSNFEMLQGWMRVQSGAKMYTGTAKLGTPGGPGAAVVVTDAGSTWVVTNPVERVSVRVTRQGYVNLGPSVEGFSIRVEGTGSKLEFGEAGGDGSMHAASGATIIGEDLVLLKGGGSSRGNSLIKLKTLGIGIEGPAQFEIAEGGSVECNAAALGLGKDGSATLTVTGAESSWRISELLGLGGDEEAPAKGTLDIKEGGYVTVGSKAAVRVGSIVQVTGVNSALDAREAEVVVGVFAPLGTGTATIRIAQGGRTLARKLVLGPRLGGEGVTTVDGTASRLDVGESIAVGNGDFLTKGTLTIRNGATASVSRIEVGNSSQDNRVLISEPGSSLTVSNYASIGDRGVGTLTVANGGKLVAAGSYPERQIQLGNTRDGNGTLVVDGTFTSVDFPDGLLTVGFAGTGRLTVSSGAQVNVKNCVLGWESSSSSSALVTGRTPNGTGSRLFVGSELEVGGFPAHPAPAALDVTDFGVVFGGNIMRIGQKGRVRLDNTGSVLIGTGGTEFGKFVVGVNGTLILADGAYLAAAGFVWVGKVIHPRGPILINPPLPAETLKQSGLALMDYRHAAKTTSLATVDGPLTLAATSTVELQFAGTPSQQNSLRFTGAVALGGKLVLQFTDGFAPRRNDKFSLFKFDSTITGQFAQIEIAGLASGFQYDLKPDASGLYTFTALTDGTATSSPRLSIEALGAGLIITWADTATGYTLQSTSDLGSANWQPRATTANRYIVPSSQPAEFFRLIKP